MIVTTSWDDGHVLDLRLADLLREAGLAATFYIAPRNRELPAGRRLSGPAIGRLATEFEVGSHTLTHPVLTRVPLHEAEREMTASRDALADLTGQAVTSFCYPRGAHSAALAGAARRSGYTYARTVGDLELGAPADPWRAATSLETGRPGLQHWPASICRSAAVSTSLVRRLDWGSRAIAMFELARQRDGVFHLWGHSWVLDRRDQWGVLRRVLAHIGGRSGVTYVPNRALGAA